MPRLFSKGRSAKGKDDVKLQNLDTDSTATPSKQPFVEEIEETEETKEADAPWKALFYFTTRSHTACLTIAISSSVLAGLTSPAQALLIGKAFGAFTNVTNGSAFLSKETKYVYYMLGVGVGSWLLHFIFFTAWVAFGELQANSARDRLFRGMLEKDIEWFEVRKNGIGALIPRIQAQVCDLQLATAQPLGSFITLLASACMEIGLAFYYSWKLTLVIVSTTPLIIGVVGYLGASIQPYVRKQLDQMTVALKAASGALNSIESIKCLNGQGVELEKYSKTLDDAAGWYYRVVNANGLQFGFTQFMASAMMVQGFYYGGVLVDNGQKNSGEVVTTFMAAIGAFQSISGILPQMLVLEKGRTAGETLRAVMSQVLLGPNEARLQGKLEPEVCVGDIRFENVSFSYPARPDQLALRSVNMLIPGGAVTYIIGRSGSGKSTVGQLLMNFYKAKSGTITLDGLSLSKLNASWLRKQVTLVEQRTSLFEDTLSRNIALGRTNGQPVSAQEVWRAAEFALLQLMINDLPLGLGTIVGSRGGTMSGGQRQRMALARAYIRNTPILILDESTSALDQVSRSLMMDAIRRWRHDRTTIVVTHDISQIMPDDYAIVFEEGRLVQEGYRRHIERVEGAAFYGFLSEAERDEVPRLGTTQDAARNHLAQTEMRTSATSYDDDALEAHLSAGEKSNRSFLPVFFINKHTSAAFQGAYGLGGPINTFRQPPPVYDTSPTTPSDSSHTNDPWPRTMNDVLPKKQKQRQPVIPEALEKFMINTGDLAARARLTQASRGTRRLQLNVVSPGLRTLELKASYDKADNDTADSQVESMTVILGTIWPSLDWHVRIVMILGFLAAGLNAASTPIFANILSRLIETYGTGAEGKKKSVTYSLVILGIAVAGAICTYLAHTMLEFVGQNWVNHIRASAMERVLDQPLEFFAREENSVSRITESLDRHAEEMRNLLGRFSLVIFNATIMITVTVTWAMITDWKITLIALAVGPYVFFVTKAFSAVSSKWEGKSNDASAIAGAIFTETFTSIKTVRGLTLESHFSDKYTTATRATLYVGMKRAIYSGFFYGLSDSSGTFTMALIFYAGARLVKEGAPAYKIIEVFIQLIITIGNISNLLSFIPQVNQAKDSASRILRLSKLPKSSHEHWGNTHITSVGDITISDLTFSYPSRPAHPVLESINLTIPAGKSTAIVGSSGSGKSTIASLLLNLYPPIPTFTGPSALFLASRDARHIHTPTLRSLITIVPQTPTIFAASILENITYGLPSTSAYNNLDSVRAAAAAAGIDDFIVSLPGSYTTLLGDEGTTLSGGQAQRLAIARALVRNPAVLVLDEATSALDAESAALVRATVQGLVGRDGLTVVIITHSKEMMAMVERIVVLDRGRVVEVGGYAELSTRRGPFLRLLRGGEWIGEEEEERKESVGVAGMSEYVDWNGEGKGKGKARAA